MKKYCGVIELLINKDNEGNVLGESNVFDVEEKPEFGTLFLKLDFRKQQQTSEDLTAIFFCT